MNNILLDKEVLQFLSKNLAMVSIIIFLLFFAILVIFKPSIAFDKNNIPRNFGIGYKKKTILPVWLLVIVFAIMSYLITIYLANFNRFVF
tara:strand:- start:7001 stop:7270 length:270 start_codon:yes stop_codon:yes gene_type:complete